MYTRFLWQCIYQERLKLLEYWLSVLSWGPVLALVLVLVLVSLVSLLPLVSLLGQALPQMKALQHPPQSIGKVHLHCKATSSARCLRMAGSGYWSHPVCCQALPHNYCKHRNLLLDQALVLVPLGLVLLLLGLVLVLLGLVLVLVLALLEKLLHHHPQSIGKAHLRYKATNVARCSHMGGSGYLWPLVDSQALPHKCCKLHKLGQSAGSFVLVGSAAEASSHR